MNENGFDTSITSPAFEFAYMNFKTGSAATTFALSRSAASSSSKTTKIFINTFSSSRLLYNYYDVLKESSIWLCGGTYCGKDMETASISIS